jgi:hypothetical protein
MRGALAILALATLCGCPAPSYELGGSPRTVFPGFDASKGIVGRWVCTDLGLDLVRIHDAEGDAMVNLNADMVVRNAKAISGGGTEFKISWRAALFTSKTFRLLVPDDVHSNVTVETEDTDGTSAVTTKDLCVPAPMMQVIR